MLQRELSDLVALVIQENEELREFKASLSLLNEDESAAYWKQSRTSSEGGADELISVELVCAEAVESPKGRDAPEGSVHGERN